MTNLRDYQSAAVADIRRIIYAERKRSVVSQLPTGAGKTVIVAEIAKAVTDNGKRVWFIVPRKELVTQSKAQFAKRGVSFAVVDAAHKESRAYKAHIISLQTLIRRLDKIKEFPDVVFFDECHVNYDAQLKIMRYFECAACKKSFFENGVRTCAEQSASCQKVKGCGKWGIKND